MPAIYLMRHGQAEPAAVDDAGRALSLEGMLAVTSVGGGLAKMGVGFDRIYCSPYARTLQTAEGLVRALASTVRAEPLDALRPGASPEVQFEALGVPLGAATLVIGHMPDISYLCGYLVAGQAVGVVAFAPATLCCIDFAATPRPGSGTVRWVMTAEQIIRQGVGP